MAAKHILITGASGLIGSRLTELLTEQGHTVAHLSRSVTKGPVKTFLWNPDRFTMDPEALKGVDAVVHLAGAGVAEKRWTNERKKEILESRTRSAALLFEELNRNGGDVKTFISASGMNYYGMTDSDRYFVESDPPGNDFLAEVCKQWEQEADKVETLSVRVVKVRIGVVLAPKGGALESMSKPIRWGIGSPLGSGDQIISWIHIDDLCRLLIKSIEDGTMQGAYNAVTPFPVTNRELTKMIAHKMKKPLFLPAVPEFVLRLVLGEMADIVLKGGKLSTKKVTQTGFRFQFERIEDALDNLFRQR